MREQNSLDLSKLISFYNQLPDKKTFFNSYFNQLAGNAILKQQIIEGKSEAEIKETWAFDLEKFKRIREKYLLYTDFESRIDVK